jgi:hypothetical protein
MMQANCRCRTLHDFHGAAEEDLPFKKNTVLHILSTSEDPQWWLAEDQMGHRGVVPANYVEVRLSSLLPQKRREGIKEKLLGGSFPMYTHIQRHFSLPTLDCGVFFFFFGSSGVDGGG